MNKLNRTYLLKKKKMFKMEDVKLVETVNYTLNCKIVLLHIHNNTSHLTFIISINIIETNK